MMSTVIQNHSRPTVAFGPELPGIGSWDWVGGDTLAELSRFYETVTFTPEAIPDCDVLVIVKYNLPVDVVCELARTRAVIFCPIDYYGISAEIDRDARMLSQCSRILVHSRELAKYFRSYAPTDYFDHHLKFVPEEPVRFREEGFVLWVGMRTHLPLLAEWVNRHPLPGPLRILTNLDAEADTSPAGYGFQSDRDVWLEAWSAARHLELVSLARCAIDIKGDDFRQRHKPPAKALDFLASGLPLAMNADSSPVAHLREWGFDVASPLDSQRWLSREYYQETQQLGRQLRETLSLPNIGLRFKQVIDAVLDERGQQTEHDRRRIPVEDPSRSTGIAAPRCTDTATPVKVAIVSLLFSWPSTGGGNIHTLELAKFLTKAGYDVRHFFARFANWEVGRCDAGCPFPSEAIEFSEEEWSVAGIGGKFRRAVAAFAPDHVIITDSWNFKPHLAAALRNYPYFLRMQALECLCPLNNLQLLPVGGGIQRCPLNQLATPRACRECLEIRGRASGELHQAERALSGVGTPEYDRLLRQTVRDAEAVLTLNPLIAEMYRPFARRVEVVTWGMDAERFTSTGTERRGTGADDGVVRLLFAGLVPEWIKGFHVLHEACARLWERRRDFELIATSDPVGRLDDFTRLLGWQSQERLPALYQQADICVVPTVVPDGLSRTSVEAMATGIPVIASGIGGLPYTVLDGVTGLLCRPGDVEDWMRQISRLLDNAPLRQLLGDAGRRQFEERFRWETVIQRQYVPLLSPSGPTEF